MENTGYTKHSNLQALYGELLAFTTLHVIKGFKGPSESSKPLNGLERQFNQDVLAVSTLTEPTECQMLEQRLVNSVVGFQSTQSYSSVVINEHLDRIYSALDYVRILEQKSELAESLRVRRLKKAIIRATALEKRAYFDFFIPRDKEERSLLSEVKRELNR